MRKFFIVLLFIVSVILTAITISVRFFPQLYTSAFNHFSNNQASIENIKIQFFPLSAKLENFEFTNKDTQKLLNVKEVDFTVQLIGWLQGKNNFWEASITDADINIDKILESTTNNSETKDSTTTEKTHLHNVLSMLNIQIKNVRININEQSYVSIKRLNTTLNDTNLSDYRLIHQEIDFSIDYYDNSAFKESFTFEGLIQSRLKDNTSVINVIIPELELSQILDSKPTEINQKESVQLKDSPTPESPIDWSWMSSLAALKLSISAEEIILADSKVSNLALAIKLDKEIEFSQTSEIVWLESESFSFDDKLSMTGKWQPISDETLGADLQGQLSLATSTLNLNIDGKVNINGINDNDLNIALESKALPVRSTLDQTNLTLIKQYFPVKTSLTLNQSEHLIDIKLHDAKLGTSDLKGALNIKTKPSTNMAVMGNFQSSVLSFQSPEDTLNSSDQVNRSPDAPKKDKERIFNDDVIDWSWIENLDIDFNLQAQSVLIDNIAIESLTLPLTISNNVLNIAEIEANLADGKIQYSTKLAKNNDDVTLSVNMIGNDIILEKLNILPPEELKNGMTNINMNLETNGNTLHELASSLNGFIKLKVNEGVIGNGSFELIGSDFILGLLDKLNPFSKKDKTTKLECAVVNLNIEKGEIEIDKSLALRTSKLNIVSDGNIDLKTEKISLNLTPKARSGVGVDVSSLVKFIALGGTLSKPAPKVTAAGALKSAAVVGAAISTGGVSLLATNAAEKTLLNVDVCERASKAFQ